MNGSAALYRILEELNIHFEYYEHPPAPTIEEAMKYWKDLQATHCKNIFFRNHKGNRHYLVILEHRQQMVIRDLEQRLKQGKLTFASPKRLIKYLGVEPGSVTPFGLINDVANHVHVFLDNKIRLSDTISFHPNVNTASLVISFADFIRYLDWTGNNYEWIDLY